MDGHASHAVGLCADAKALCLMLQNGWLNLGDRKSLLKKLIIKPIITMGITMAGNAFFPLNGAQRDSPTSKTVIRYLATGFKKQCCSLLRSDSSTAALVAHLI